MRALDDQAAVWLEEAIEKEILVFKIGKADKCLRLGRETEEEKEQVKDKRETTRRKNAATVQNERGAICARLSRSGLPDHILKSPVIENFWFIARNYAELNRNNHSPEQQAELEAHITHAEKNLLGFEKHTTLLQEFLKKPEYNSVKQMFVERF